MDYSTYEIYDFDHASAFNMSTGYKERSYPMHWHSYGEILLVGPGETNIYKVGKNTYHLVPDDLVLVWPMETHEIVDADREKSLVIQFSNGFINSLFDLQRIMHLYRNVHVICVIAHPELAAKWLNFWFTDKGSQLANYGVAGEGFDEASGGFSELILNNPDGLNYRDCLSQYTVTCVPYYNHVNRDMATYNSDVVEASAIWSSNRDDAYNYPGMATLDSDESAEFAQLYSDLGTVVSEQLPEFVMGVKDMSEWDGFVQTLKDMKIERCIELKQSALDRYLER